MNEDAKINLSNTYQGYLRRQHTPGLQLQAGEVATYRRKRSPAVPIAAILIGLGLMIWGMLG